MYTQNKKEGRIHPQKLQIKIAYKKKCIKRTSRHDLLHKIENNETYYSDISTINRNYYNSISSIFQT